MSLVSNITALAGAIRDKINLMVPRLVPSGGTAGQVLAKGSSSDYDMAWVTKSAGGGTQQVYVQQTRPIESGPWVWWATDGNGLIVDLVVNDGA